ncbi:MAG: F0F1 ATP synthase subunit epsilon [Eubacteriales bacterium]|nr:F0F1 ATP synthase subunit epsilon [Sarcina sp.]MBR2729689.1 F0F1 ATP synthase subunit epsilon [Lachnospiraceae bacterium]MDO4418087.1 F0F1 ATP synthase subunit epsilon [Eubacteriales bacterium]
MAATFHLQIVTVDGLEFEGDVQRLTFRSTHGDLAILARHINYCTPVGMGTARVLLEDGTERTAACIGGMCSMMDNECRLLPTTWEWSEEIDLERAEEARKRAEEILRENKLSEETRIRTEAKLYRALVRIGSARK